MDSGNGAHLLYRIQLPNNPESTDLLRRVLETLAFRFDDEKVTIDTGVYNASRLVKLPGTVTRKGDNVPERPHRVASVQSAPDCLTVVDRAQLASLAATVPSPEATAPNRSCTSFDIERWIADHGLQVVGPKPWANGRKWIFPVCPWNPDHANRSAYLVQFRNGAVQAGCLHDSCAGKDWHALRDLYEPGWRQQRAPETDSAHPKKEVWAERKLQFQTAAEIASSTDPEVVWIVRAWIAAACMTILSGKVKAGGKTTWVLRMVAAVLDGLPFMGEPTVKTTVVYLTEQPLPSFREALKIAGLLERQDLSVLPWSNALGFGWPEVINAAVKECQRLGAKLLVVDTFPQFAQLSGDAENNAGDALAAVLPLQQAMSKGSAVLLVIHDRKSGGDVGDSGRGSSAFTGAADIVLSIRRPEGDHRPTMRRIEALSRFADTPSGLVIELTPTGYVAHGSADDVAAQEAEAKLLEVLPSSEADAMTMEDLVEVTKATRTTIQRTLEKLGKHVCRVGTGKRGDPRRYYLRTPTVSAQTTGPIGQKENEPQVVPEPEQRIEVDV